MKPLFLVAVFAFSVLLIGPSALGQDESPKEATQSPPESSPADEAEAVELAPAEEVRQLIKEKKFAAAAERLDAALAESDPADDDPEQRQALQSMRSTIVTGFARARKYGKAFSQGEKQVQELVETYDNASKSNLLIQRLSVARAYGSRAGKADRVAELIDLVFEKVKEVTRDAPVEYAKAMARLVPLKVMQVAVSGDLEAADSLVREHLDELDALEVDGDDEVEILIAKTQLLSSRNRLPNADEETADALKQFVTSALDAHPDSIPMLTEYARTETSLIGRMVRSEPTDAQGRIEDLRERLGDRSEANATLKAVSRALGSMERIVQSSLKLLEMIGKPAPDFEIDAWVNAGDTTLDSLKGKVVLVDFWAVWCGPCIVSFPHLREWREEFKEKGFEIVGVTRYYNYRWDEEGDRATRAAKDDEVPPEEEQETLKRFLAKYELEHPTVVTPEGSKMQSNYGVTGIPHVAIIGREGNVELVKVGAGQETADAIHAKLKELLP